MTTLHALLFRVDETLYYNIDEKDKPFIKSIHGVYVAQTEIPTHLCSLDKSYWALHCYNTIEFMDRDLPIEIVEMLEEKYCYSNGEDDYYHENFFMKLKEQDKHIFESKAYVIDLTESSINDIGTFIDEMLEEMREYACTNSHW